MPLSAADIRQAFVALSEELERQGSEGEIVVVGGAALVLLYGARESTKDVDAFFIKPQASVLRTAAAAVANRLDLPAEWLNDGAKGYLVGLTIGETLHASPRLIVHAASMSQLLAMKLSAWRDAIDRGDARLLLSHMSGTADEIWERVKVFIPTHQLDKAAYAFEDLWETLRGSS